MVVIVENISFLIIMLELMFHLALMLLISELDWMAITLLIVVMLEFCMVLLMDLYIIEREERVDSLCIGR